jgi:pilus assembly protein CpaF
MVNNLPPSGQSPEIILLKNELVQQILRDFDMTAIAPEDYNQILIDLILKKFQEQKLNLSDEIRNPLFHQIIDEVLGFGILQPLMDDPGINEILVKGSEAVFIQRNGKISQTSIRFKNNQDLLNFIDRNVRRLELTLNSESPALSAILPDNSRLNILLPPIAFGAPLLAIQKFTPSHILVQDLISNEVISEPILQFLQACVVSKLNILIIGLENAGKTTFLNNLASFIPSEERIAVIEDVPELNLSQPQLLRLETNKSLAGTTSVNSPLYLLQSAIRLNPNRIILGNLCGAECFAFLETANTGFSGSLAALQARSASDAIHRLETLSQMSGTQLPVIKIREEITSAVDLILLIAKMKDGTFRVTAITEISGMEGENVILTDIFRFEQTGMDLNGRILGSLRSTQIRPIFCARLEANGFSFSPELFGYNLSSLHHVTVNSKS